MTLSAPPEQSAPLMPVLAAPDVAIPLAAAP
jgi:hypothetical protein